MVSVFSYTDYKKLLAALINDSPDKKFRPALIAAIGCQKSFFSQVLNGSVHLTPDHAANLVEFLGFDDLSAEYCITLVNYARAGSAALRARLTKNLEGLRNRATQPSERLKWPFLKDSEIQSVYYSSWVFAVVHIIVSIPKYQTQEKIADRLGLPLRRVQEITNWLVGAKLIKKTSQGFSVLETGLHLKSTSHLIEMHHTHWRNQALTNLQRGDSEAVHYSAVFAMSRDDFAKLKTMAMGFLKEATSVIAPSKSEEVYSMGFDLFQA